MINLYDDGGVRIVPWAAAKNSVGKAISTALRYWGAKCFVPFSSMHRYQRSDSIWADEFTTRLPDYRMGFELDSGTLLPAFIRYDCVRDTREPLNPVETRKQIFSPEEFGDNWSDQLESLERAKITAYFKSISHLERHWNFINFRVGGKEHHIEFTSRNFRRGITFEAPLQSLMVAVENEVFDDMLIGNFMKTTLHGHFDFPQSALYPDFTPYVGKYADNGLAKSSEQLRNYFAAYQKRAPIDYLRHRLHKRSVERFRTFFDKDSGIYRLAKRAYRAVISG